MNRPQAADAQLAGIRQGAVLRKVRLDQALNMREFAVLAGLSYSTTWAWFRPAGFPFGQRRFFGAKEWRGGEAG